MPSNYDNSAWFYDRLSRLIYGKALVNAQVYLLPYVPPNSSVLIVGGGTGWILEELARVHPTGLTITYVEISSKMMALSKSRNYGDNRVTYINQAVEDVIFTEKFDVVITPFLFDNFKEETLQKVFGHLHHQLKTGGLWLNTDFQLTGRWWQNVLLKSMFLFFRAICGIETSVLPHIEQQFKQHDYSVITEKTFFWEFVVSAVFSK
ncbi:class I SAM-dependent methyltransferase [Mucilaginibacter sp. UYCu711]|uniref:class I SAM-dependent methyltransferase n=1 Tax=Mucilaginibacter sp. UYCu711 TaxID=3156339 RepID=UPI003D1E2F96